MCASIVDQCYINIPKACQYWYYGGIQKSETMFPEWENGMFKFNK